jgi:pimeloyl-ACP methyl ester carboxylesterase
MATFNFKGVDLHYRIEGSGLPLLLIHGTQPDGDTWGKCFDELAKQYCVVTYDRRGFSRSVHPPITDYKTHAEDAAALLKSLVLGPTTVLGWSWGGIVALELAASAPELVSSLILVEPALHLKKHMTFSLFKAVGKVQLLRAFKGDVSAAQAFLRWANQYNTGGTAFDYFSGEVLDTIQRSATAIVKEIDAGTGEKLTVERISSIHCPVTCVQAELSAPEFKKAIERVAKMIPRTKIQRISGASHAIHFDCPNEFVNTISKSVNDKT